MATQHRQQNNAIDLLAAVVLCAVGITALVLALDFDNESRAFPAAVSALLVLVAAVSGALAIVRRQPLSSPTGGFVAAAAACAVLIAWSIALSLGGGFILPTLLMQLALLSICGVRRSWALVTLPVLITLGAYLLFAVALDVPMPISRLPVP